MNASHESLRDLYQCSHPDLDKLVTIGEEFRYGARLTGAGYVYKYVFIHVINKYFKVGRMLRGAHFSRKCSKVY
jgi:galactokinase